MVRSFLGLKGVSYLNEGLGVGTALRKFDSIYLNERFW